MPRRKKEEIISDDEEDFSGENNRKFHKPIQRNAANARERARMRVLSKAFVKLKTTLPWVPADTKLSKLDTLRLASSYIAHLRHVLTNDEEETQQPPFMHPMNLVSWNVCLVNMYWELNDIFVEMNIHSIYLIQYEIFIYTCSFIIASFISRICCLQIPAWLLFIYHLNIKEINHFENIFQD